MKIIGNKQSEGKIINHFKKKVSDGLNNFFIVFGECASARINNPSEKLCLDKKKYLPKPIFFCFTRIFKTSEGNNLQRKTFLLYQPWGNPYSKENPCVNSQELILYFPKGIQKFQHQSK